MEVTENGDTGPRHRGLIVLMPDAMRQDVWGPLARRLRPLCLEVVATTALMLRPPTLSALYANGKVKQQRPSRSPSAWLSFDLAALDMSIVAVVATPLDIDLPRVLDDWKGPSHFGTRREGDLRSVSMSSHRCLSLLHTPDNAGETTRDIRLLLGAATHEHLDDGKPGRCRFEDLQRLRMYRPPAADQHPYGIVYRCLARAAAVLAYDHLLRPSPEWSAFADRCDEVCRQSNPDSPEEVVARLEADTRALLADLPTPPRPAPDRSPVEVGRRMLLVDALTQLLSPIGYGPECAVDVLTAFEANDLYLDPWERHLLQVALSFHEN
jgi:hypothetical protein